MMGKFLALWEISGEKTRCVRNQCSMPFSESYHDHHKAYSIHSKVCAQHIVDGIMNAGCWVAVCWVAPP